MELFLDPQAWLSFLTLTVLEIVLGIDNIIFIALLVGRLPVRRQESARIVARDLDDAAIGQKRGFHSSGRFGHAVKLRRGPARLKGAGRRNDYCRDNSTENSPLLMRGARPAA